MTNSRFKCAASIGVIIVLIIALILGLVVGLKVFDASTVSFFLFKIWSNVKMHMFAILLC